MKKLVLILTLLSSSIILNAANIYDSMDKFIEGEKQHKKECFESEKNFMIAKLDLLKKQHAEKYDMKREALHKLRDEGFSEEMLKHCLAKKVAMCERHLEEWKELCDAHHERGKELYRHGKEMLRKFKQSYMDEEMMKGYSYGSDYDKEQPEGFLEKLERMVEGLSR